MNLQTIYEEKIVLSKISVCKALLKQITNQNFSKHTKKNKNNVALMIVLQICYLVFYSSGYFIFVLADII